MQAVSRANAAAFLVASAAGGGFNYAFQLLAASNLQGAEYGRFSVWFGTLAGALLTAGMVHNASLLAPVSAVRMPVLARWAALVAAVGLALVLLVAPAGAAALTVVFSALAAALAGQCQARGLFAPLSASMFVAGLARVATPLVAPGDTWFRTALPVAACLTLATLGVWLARMPAAAFPSQAAPFHQKPLQHGAAALLLAVGPGVFPNLDILTSSTVFGDATAGDVGRCALAGKLVFFACLPVLGLLLPAHLGSASPWQVRVEKLLGVGVLAAAIPVWAFFPWVAQRLLHTPLQHLTSLLALCTLNASLLLLLQLRIQKDLARARLAPVVAALAFLGAANVALTLLRLSRVELHVGAALGVTALSHGVMVLAGMGARRTSTPGQ